MADNATLKATIREETGTGAMRRMRRAGRIPAVVYGRGEETRAVSLDAHEFEMLVKHHSLDTTLVELSIEGAGRKGGTVRTLVAEVQAHPYKPEVLHVDFQQIHAGERVTVEVPIHLTGTAQGVRDGGVLQHVLHQIELICTVEQIPESFDVDVSALLVGDSVHVSDLDVPEDVELLVSLERTVCTVAAPTILEVPEPEEAEEPELVGAEGEEAEEDGEAGEAGDADEGGEGGPDREAE